MKKIHLICNAHLDPVWLWEWEEGAAEAVSTFRVAADFCEQYEGFVFNHNEVILYKWVEEYEPELFRRIQNLVQEGKWHIMGGWYLQPDCNMPSGESFVRQALTGRQYFRKKFGVVPTTAINFDPFGHTRGLVQILKKSGYNSYIFCRPGQKDCPLPADEFIWVGYDGSEIICHRSLGYLSHRGTAHRKVQNWIESNPDISTGLILWGIGNHGGGPSRIDLENLKILAYEIPDYTILHSTPEEYFNEVNRNTSSIPKHNKDLNPWAPGCYTSQVRIKQKHRLLENEYYMLEKMMSNASLQGYLAYPVTEMNEALNDLMMAEFHDILPGSSIQPVEETAIRLMDHALEIISRLKARAFFALSGGQPKAQEGEIPILVYNPHPYKVKGIFECEFQLPDQNWKEEFSLPVVYKDGVKIPSQAEKEQSNLNLDWRKRTVFATELEAGQMCRFDCKIEVLPSKPEPLLQTTDEKITFQTDALEVVIDCKTGLMEKYAVYGKEFIHGSAFLPLVIKDNDDSWGTALQSFAEIAGEFRLMSAVEGTEFSGIKEKTLSSVRIIEDGAVRTVVEAVFSYGNSFICQHYKLPKQGTEIQVVIRAYWNEKSKMLKLSIPTTLTGGKYIGQVAYGRAELPGNRKEAVSQKWVGIMEETDNAAFTCINDGIYGSDYKDGEIRISLLRSPGYSSLPISDRPLMAQDRYSTRIDQGERSFTVWVNAGKPSERLSVIDREALAYNEKPFILSFFPSGSGKKPLPAMYLSDDTIHLSNGTINMCDRTMPLSDSTMHLSDDTIHINNSTIHLSDDTIHMSDRTIHLSDSTMHLCNGTVLLTAFKKAEVSDDYIIRLFEPTGTERTAYLDIPSVGVNEKICLGAFEIKTLKLSKGVLTEVDLMEEEM